MAAGCPSDLRGACREEGFAGLWRGVTPNIGRNAIINAAELASYDSVRPCQANYHTSMPRILLTSLCRPAVFRCHDITLMCIQHSLETIMHTFLCRSKRLSLRQDSLRTRCRVILHPGWALASSLSSVGRRWMW